MTECPDCQLAEMTRLQRNREAVRRALMTAFGLGPSRQSRAIFGGMAGIIAAATGSRPRTWYDRHREDWEATGDPDELARMLRHIDG